MKLKSKAILGAAKRKPALFAIPIVPVALMISNFVMSLMALRKVRRLSRSVSAA